MGYKTMVFCQNRLWILTHHLKGLSLSFQKNHVIGQSELKLWPFKRCEGYKFPCKELQKDNVFYTPP